MSVEDYISKDVDALALAKAMEMWISKRTGIAVIDFQEDLQFCVGTMTKYVLTNQDGLMSKGVDGVSFNFEKDIPMIVQMMMNEYSTIKPIEGLF
jgi:hypothetical protein